LSSNAGGGGGGAGGYRTGTASLNPTLSYTVTVGAGGNGGPAGQNNGSSGSDSVFNAVTSTGGGYGATRYTAGGNGGSGGGGGLGTGSAGGSGNTPSTSPSQGNNGGNGLGTSTGGGGGGASASGTNAPANQTGGNGGAGTANSISGSSVTYAGGGGAGGTTIGTGGAGGGGNGGNNSNGVAGTANLGGGGGGAYDQSSGGRSGGNGGSGIVIISYAGAQQFSGGVVTSVGGNTIHTFTTSGTLGPITTLSASYLIVAGGGGGGGRRGGGGGAGGLLTGSVTIDPNSTYLVTVGAGGAGGVGTPSTDNTGSSGTNSAFSMVATSAVGGGAGDGDGEGAGLSGGSGGGGSGGAGGAGTSGQGNNGGSGSSSAPNYGGGGGGGASAVGTNGTSTVGGAGGAGTASSISGTSTTYAGGGGGGTYQGGTAGSGGAGGGGGGGTGGTDNNGTDGTANTGGGGGGGSIQADSSNRAGGAGGSGVVIISYPGATQQMAGGTVTIVGGNVIHTFTSTGFLAPIKLSTGSLRMRSSNSAYLSRTPTVAGNRQKFTISMWVKRGDLTARQGIIAAGTTNLSSLPGGAIYFDNTAGGNGISIIGAGGTSYSFTTTQKFRDPAAWYHLVFAWDTTQATSTNRFIMYVNGLPVTSFASATYPTQNFSTDYNNTIVQGIGTRTDDGALPASPFDGEMTEVYMIDGQQLAPSSFGTFNSFGVWQPITYGGSYGTNGFYLPFNRQAVSFAGSFNGSSQYLTPTATTLFDITSTTQTFTLEAYVYATSINASGPPAYRFTSILSKGIVYISFGYTDAGILRFYMYNGSENYIDSSTGIVVAGKWNHLAVVSNAGVVTLYANGVAVKTGSLIVPTGGNGSSPKIGAADTSQSADYFNGRMSNLRITNTAVYTSNFVPSTSALTAITGTQFLTLQNSSIVDNSTNAYSITNTGGVSTGQTYPFAYGIFNDQGPAGNNWTPSGISGVFGSTLDYMGDAPTLTSATVANYAVMNPLVPSTGTNTNGNLTVSIPVTSASPATIFANTGKWYWEVVWVSGGFYRIGVCNSTGAGQDFGATANGWCKINSPARVYNNGSATSYGTDGAVGDTYMVALDLDAGKIWYGINGTWQASGSPSTGANPSQTFTANQTMSPAVASGSGTQVYNFNFGQQPFTYTPPSGFIALNLYNL
jgi:hypothetical protein